MSGQRGEVSGQRGQGRGRRYPPPVALCRDLPWASRAPALSSCPVWPQASLLPALCYLPHAQEACRLPSQRIPCLGRGLQRARRQAVGRHDDACGNERGWKVGRGRGGLRAAHRTAGLQHSVTHRASPAQPSPPARLKNCSSCAGEAAARLGGMARHRRRWLCASSPWLSCREVQKGRVQEAGVVAGTGRQRTARELQTQVLKAAKQELQVHTR